MRTTTTTEVAVANILVEAFEMQKQKSNSATKNVTILWPGAEETVIIEFEEGPLETGDDLRPHKQCPWETEDNGQPFQTEGLMSILVEVVRLPQRAHCSARHGDLAG